MRTKTKKTPAPLKLRGHELTATSTFRADPSATGKVNKQRLINHRKRCRKLDEEETKVFAQLQKIYKRDRYIPGVWVTAGADETRFYIIERPQDSDKNLPGGLVAQFKHFEHMEQMLEILNPQDGTQIVYPDPPLPDGADPVRDIVW